LTYAITKKNKHNSRINISGNFVSAIKPYEGFGDVDHTIKELMSF
jgi:hypothetical protein